MSSDRELLELAANAAGYEVILTLGGGGWINDGSRIWPKWNPLTDDGEALRLSIDLKLQISHSDFCVTVGTSGEDGEDLAAEIIPSCFPGHRQKLTRRAIVRAAAYIGNLSP